MSATLHTVCYFWMEDGTRKDGHTVVTARTLEEAIRRFQRQHPHVTAITP